MPPTRSPTWCSVTSGPTAVTTPAKSVPSCGSLPVEARVPAERDEDIGEVDAGRGDRDLDLSRSRRNPVERDEFHRLQVTGRADLQAHTVVLVVDDGGSPLLGAQRAGAQPRRVPLAVRATRSRPPPTRPAVAAPAARPPSRRRRRSGWRADADVRCRSLASGHAARPAPGWPRRRAARSGHFWSRRTGAAARPEVSGKLAGDAHQMAAHTPRRASAHCSSGLPFRGAVRTTTPRTPSAPRAASRSVRRWPRWSACCGQLIVVHSRALRVSAHRPAWSPGDRPRRRC